MPVMLELPRTLTRKHCEHTRLASLSQLIIKASTSLVFAQGALSRCCWLLTRSDSASSMMKMLCANCIEFCRLEGLNVSAAITPKMRVGRRNGECVEVKLEFRALHSLSTRACIGKQNKITC